MRWTRTLWPLPDRAHEHRRADRLGLDRRGIQGPPANPRWSASRMRGTSLRATSKLRSPQRARSTNRSSGSPSTWAASRSTRSYRLHYIELEKAELGSDLRGLTEQIAERLSMTYGVTMSRLATHVLALIAPAAQTWQQHDHRRGPAWSRGLRHLSGLRRPGIRHRRRRRLDHHCWPPR